MKSRMERHFQKKNKITNCSLTYQKYLIKTHQKISINNINSSHWERKKKERPFPNRDQIKAMILLTNKFLNPQGVKTQISKYYKELLMLLLVSAYQKRSSKRKVSQIKDRALLMKLTKVSLMLVQLQKERNNPQQNNPHSNKSASPQKIHR